MELKVTSSDTPEHLQQRLAQLKRQLDNVLQQHQSMLYTLSHDLRTPVMTILGFTDMLIDDLGAAGSQKQAMQYLQHVRQAAMRQSKIIEALLQLSRLWDQEIKPETVDLMELARASAQRLQAAEPARQVQLMFDDAAPVHADRQLFATVVDALLANAWKFTSKRTDAVIEVRAQRENGEIVYCVADNGAGFDPQSAERLFQPLKRLHSDKEFPGAGLGLATAATIIRRHGGDIRAAAAPGEGARFYFTVGSAQGKP